MADDEWSIQQIAKIAGTTSRTLRHYGEIGLLPPSSVGHNGYRHYDRNALVRLQRILLLRELGLGLPQIGEVLARETSQEDALTGHLAWLRQEQDRLERQIVSVQLTIEALRGGERLMAEDMFDGFDHTQYKDEVEERWGKKAYADSDRWWRGMSADEKSAWKQRVGRSRPRLDRRGRERKRARQRRGAGCREAPRGVADRDSRHTRCGARRRRQGVRDRTRRDVRRRRALRRELRDERGRHGRCGVRPRRAARLRGGESVVPRDGNGCRVPTNRRGAAFVISTPRLARRRGEAGATAARGRGHRRVQRPAAAETAPRQTTSPPSCEATSSGAGRSSSSESDARAASTRSAASAGAMPDRITRRGSNRLPKTPVTMLSTLPARATSRSASRSPSLASASTALPSAAAGQESASAPSGEISPDRISSCAHRLILTPRPPASSTPRT